MRNDTVLVILAAVLIVSAFLLIIVKLAEFITGSYGPKRVRKRERNDGLVHLLAPSIVGMCLCAVCLCGASWAWFTAASATDIAGIQFARFAVSVAVKQGNEDVTDDTVAQGENGTYSVALDANMNYTITITPTADSTTGGYCAVSYGGHVGYTDPMTPDSDAVSFAVTGPATLTITPSWGENKETGNLSLTPVVTDDPAEDDLPQDVPEPPQDEDNTPADDIIPGDDTPGDSNAPGDNTPADKKPADNIPGDSSPSDNAPADNNPGDSTPDGNPPDDNAGTAQEGGTSDSGTPQAGEGTPAAAADEPADSQV